MPLILSPAFERRLGALMRERSNPVRRPEELKTMLRSLSRWAADESAFMSANTKTDKTDIGKMFLSSSVKLEKTVTDQNWVVRGLALVSADMLGQVAKHDPAQWGLTPAEAARLRNVDFCPGATAGCKAVCLVNAGQMPMKSARGAQVRRSLAYIFNRPAFMLAVIVGIAGFQKWAYKQGLRPAFRLNITSDLDWENKKVPVPEWLAAYLRENFAMPWVRAGTYNNIPELFAGPGPEPRVMFYDYTKVARRMQNFAFGKTWPKNYWLTWSLAETNENRRVALWVLQNQITSVTVPFDRRSGRKGRWESAPLPDTLGFRDASGAVYSFPVINGDAHDLRFIDRFAMEKMGTGVVVGLHFKIPLAGETLGKSEKGKAEASHGFVVKADSQNPVIDVDTTRTNPGRRRRNPWSRLDSGTLPVSSSSALSRATANELSRLKAKGRADRLYRIRVRQSKRRNPMAVGLDGAEFTPATPIRDTVVKRGNKFHVASVDGYRRVFSVRKRAYDTKRQAVRAMVSEHGY